MDKFVEMGSPPELAEHVWQDFCEICGRRQYSSGGPNPISHSEIESYERQEGIELEQWERRALRRLDDAWLEAWSNGRSRRTRNPG